MYIFICISVGISLVHDTKKWGFVTLDIIEKIS